MLGVELAKASTLEVTVCDVTLECVELAKENSREHGVHDRVSAVHGAAEKLPFDNNSIDLVVSRGSIFFWEDQAQGLQEVYRVLREGGWACIGGGFGTAELLQEVLAAKGDDPEWDKHRKERLAKNPPGHFEAILQKLGINGVVERSDAGMWIIFTKQATEL